MGCGTFVHHIGAFFLFAATILLLVTSITSPVVNNISLLHVDLGDHSSYGSQITFGTFGYCTRDWHHSGKDNCTSSHVGYNPSEVANQVTGTNFSTASEDTAKALTRVFVLHPVGAGLCFLAFLICLGAGIIGNLFATFFALLAFVVTAVAMICDFVAFSIVKRDINENGGSVAVARYGTGIWTALAAAACTLIGAALVFVTCCAGRMKDRRARNRSSKGWHDEAPASRF